METENVSLILVIDLGMEVGEEKLDQSMRQLHTELRSRWDNVDFVKAPIPEGSRAGDEVVVGTLALAILPTAIQELVRLVRNWCLRAEGRTVEIEIKKSRHRTMKLKISGDVSPERIKEMLDTLEQ
jgi:hypothetical protein